MANRTYFSCTNTPVKYQDFDGKSVACAASYIVPVLWYSLFNESHLVQASTQCDDDEPDFIYDRLQAKKDEAIDLAKSRLEILKEAFGDEIEKVFLSWLEFVKSLSGEIIYIETCELVMMDEDASTYKKQARECINAFSEPLLIEKGFLFKKKQANPKWKQLFGQAEITSFTELPIMEKLCGYSWEGPVPWE